MKNEYLFLNLPVLFHLYVGHICAAMENTGINLNQVASHHYELTVSGQIDTKQMSSAFAKLASSTKIDVRVSESSASDYLLLQFLAFLRNEGKDISLRWVGEQQPTVPLSALLGI